MNSSNSDGRLLSIFAIVDFAIVDFAVQGLSIVGSSMREMKTAIFLKRSAEPENLK